MRTRLTVASAIAALALAGGLFAQAPGAAELSMTGQVVSTGNTSIVLYKDGGGEPTSFVVTTTTQLPPGLAAGKRVTVYYRQIGDRQVADRVMVAGASATPAAQASTANEGPGSARGGPSAEPEWETDGSQAPDSSQQQPAAQAGNSTAPAKPGHGLTPAEPGHGMRPADENEQTGNAKPKGESTGHGMTPAEPGHGMRPAEDAARPQADTSGHGMQAADDDPGRPATSAADASAPNDGQDEALPATASPLPIVGLAGLVALLGSIVLRASERLRSR